MIPNPNTALLRMLFLCLDCILVWEKKATPEEEERARRLQLPPTFLCGVSSDSEPEPDKHDDFMTEINKLKHTQVTLIHRRSIIFLLIDKHDVHVDVCRFSTGQRKPFP